MILTVEIDGTNAYFRDERSRLSGRSFVGEILLAFNVVGL